MVLYKHLIVVKVKKVFIYNQRIFTNQKKKYLKLFQPIDHQYLNRIINLLIFITATTKRSK